MRALLLAGISALVVSSCVQDHKVPQPTKLSGSGFAAGLKFPIGLTVGKGEVLFVTETGTGNNDGQVTAITPDGQKYPVITGFPSVISPEGSPAGLAHLKYKDGKLYILHGILGRLYVYDISAFTPGVTPAVAAGGLPFEDIAGFVASIDFTTLNFPDTGESDPYNLTFGPDGKIYITDAGANIVIRRNSVGSFEVFATVPSIATGIVSGGPPTVESVPTGIVYDGSKFLVTSLTGLPFPAGVAKIFQITPAGALTDYKTGFTGLTDIILSPGNKPVVTEFGFGPPGGRVASGEDAAVTLLSPVATAVSIELSLTFPDTYYVLSYGPGTIQKVTAE